MVDWGLLKREGGKRGREEREREREILKQQVAKNITENRNRGEHNYKQGDLVLIIMKSYERGKKPKLATLAEGPYKVLNVFTNKTRRTQRSSYETLSILGDRGLITKGNSYFIWVGSFTPYISMIHKS